MRFVRLEQPPEFALLQVGEEHALLPVIQPTWENQSFKISRRHQSLEVSSLPGRSASPVLMIKAVARST